MMTKVEIDSRLCGHTTIIEAEKEGKIIHIDIETSCRSISDFSKKLGSLALTMEDFYHSNNRVHEAAAECQLNPSCLVPCGIFNAGRIEAKLIAKSLALKEKEISIRFLE